MNDSSRLEWLECIACHAQFNLDDIRYTCGCGGLLEVRRPAGWARALSVEMFDARMGSRTPMDLSGVWRFREGVLSTSPSDVVTHPEGRTRLYSRPVLSHWAGIDSVQFKHEGENPTGSFKDRGMTVGATVAKRLGATAVACASTGNTSASMAAYAAQAGMKAVVFIPSGKVAMGKLAQTLAYGALCLQVRGDFDAAMSLVRSACETHRIYLLNSVNPFRIEGQKTIVWELLQDLGWNAPDWIVLPAGNLGNTSAFGKALREAHEGGWISRVPRLAAIQAHGANPFFRGFVESFASRHRVQAETVASAIRIGDPVSWDKAREAITFTHGVVEEVTDDEILEAKRHIDSAGIGCEPASACSLAGARRLRQRGIINQGDNVVCVLTGNLLKDPDIVLKQLAAAGSSAFAEVDAQAAAVDAVLRDWTNVPGPAAS